jgi:hypothetical protein
LPNPVTNPDRDCNSDRYLYSDSDRNSNINSYGDGHSHGDSGRSLTNPNGNVYSDRYCDFNAYCDRNGDSGRSVSNPDSNVYPDGHCDFNAYRDGDRHRHGHSDCHSYSNSRA